MKRVKSTVGIDNIPSMGMRYQPIEMNTLSVFPINIHRAQLKLPFENIITDIRNEVEKGMKTEKTTLITLMRMSDRHLQRKIGCHLL